MFPRVTFGTCKRCGGKGADYPASQLSSADSTSDLDTTGNGVELKLFRGDYLCPMCIQDIKNEEQSKRHASKHRDTETFLGKSGFTKSV